MASIAYVDPGNFATNFAAGSQHGFLLLWVVVVANLMAMLVQNLSAKLGLATGRNLPELCREHCPTSVSRGLWVQAELVTMATELAEVVGGAIALNLLFGLPLLHGGVVTAVVAFGLMELQSRGDGRRFELVVVALFSVILVGFLVSLVQARPDASAAAAGLVPRLAGTQSLLLATGILGATVMPHVVYLHSSLTQHAARGPVADRRLVLRAHRRGILVAMGLAGVVNASMLVVAATVFDGRNLPGVDTLEGVHRQLGIALDPSASLLFALALLASGLASTGVGAYAGQVVMAGFLRRTVPVLVRRAVTLGPALVVLAAGADPTRALVLSQVVLSFGIPFALVPLVLLTRRSDVMHELRNRRITTVAAAGCSVVIIGLNVLLVVRTF